MAGTLAHFEGDGSEVRIRRSWRIARGALLLLATIAFGIPVSVLGQRAPDAGRVLEENRPPAGQIPRRSDAPLIEEPIRPALKAPTGIRFKVSGFKFSGGTAFPESELKPLVAPLVGQEVSLSDLEQGADRITRYYRDHGYFVARAYIPAQDIKDGIVEILILEGKLGKVDVHPSGPLRVHPEYLENMARAAVPVDTVLRQPDIERAILLMNDLPGIQARATLLPGTQQATTNVRLDVKEGPLLSGTFEFDDYGNKFTDRNRPAVSLNVNDPLRIGDQLKFRYSGFADNRYANVAYLAPVGSRGLKLGGGYTYTDYQLCCEFSALHATGHASVWELDASYPVIRTRVQNLTASAAYDRKYFYNANITGPTSDKTDDVLTGSLGFDRRDEVFGGGLSYANLSVSVGKLDLSGNLADRQADAQTARTDGHFGKGVASLARLQSLPSNWALFGNVTTQFATKNLDSAEKFPLGGPNGVRSYPVDEALGDAGTIVNLELRRNVTERLQLFGFADYGYVTLHHSTWTGWQPTNAPGIPNGYSLAGAGLGLLLERPGDYLMRVMVAQKVGNNPGRDVNGNDSDGSNSHTRIWFQGIKRF